MSEQDKGKSLAEIAEEAGKEPITAKDRVVGIVFGVILIGFCVAVWVNPDLISIDTSEFSGRGGRKIARILNFLWSRPVGTIAGVVGLLVTWGTLTKKSPAADPAPNIK